MLARVIATLDCGRYRLRLDRPLVMGVVNITPDSFSDGGKFFDPAAAIGHALRLVDEGADLLDLGAESTRPGAAALPLDEEIERLLPVLRALRDVSVPISVDTYKPELMRVALGEGASMINDVYAFRAPGAIPAVATVDCALCVMHMQGEPRTMQADPRYADVVGEVADFLRERVAALADAGIDPSRIVVDPGFGFGKTVGQNYALLGGLEEIAGLGLPLLVGLSRKGMLGAVTGKPVGDRLGASIAAGLEAVRRGANILRVHDVAETVDALKVQRAIDGTKTEQPAKII